MAGNNKVWRAPVAGLASVAMLATMGVATANAVTVNAASASDVDVTVTVDGSEQTVTKGMTYADAVAMANGNPTLNADNGGSNFGGYTLGGKFVDLNAVAEDGAKLVPARYASGYVQIHFQTADGTSLGYVRVAADSNGNFSVPEELRPYDVADGKILKYDEAIYSIDDSNKQNKPFTWGGDMQANIGSTVVVTIPTEAAKTFTFLSKPGTGSQGTDDPEAVAYVVSYAGAIADGNPSVGSSSTPTTNEDLTVEIPVGATSYDPKAGADAMIISLNGDDVYGLDKWVDGVGNEYTADSKLEGSADGVINPVIKKANAVKFFDGDKELTDLEQAVLTGHLVSDPGAYDRGDGSTFVGWYTNEALTDQWDFAHDKVTGALSLYAKFVDDGSYTVTYKFNDGKTADKTETYLANQNVAEPADPTRDGYLFAGWYQDINGNGMLDSGDATTEYSFGAPANKDVVLIAKWIKANDATLKAAFKYVDGSKVSDNDSKYAGVFTDASFADYVKTYQAVQKDYAQAQNEATAAGTPIPDETLSKLVNELTAAWQKLEFVHKGDSQIGNTVVHRLNKDGEHFYTQDLEELVYMTTFQGWTDEGRLFQTAPRTNKADNAVYAGLQSFKKAATDEVTGYNADVEATLDSIADPILTSVTRLYNRANGDHVWSVDENEIAVLSAQADWNNEDTAFFVPTYTGSQAVTRLYKDNRHLLSTDSNEVKVLSTQGWSVEGDAFKAY